jgi:metal-responsive CopG/Arc/MetJ family transcriptional regulator
MKLTVNLPAETLKGLDKARGDTTRSIFIQRAVDKYLTHFKDGGIKRAKK